MKKILLSLLLVATLIPVQTTKPLVCEAIVALMFYKFLIAPSNRIIVPCECHKYKNIIEDLKRRMSHVESRQADADGRFARLLKDLRDKNPQFSYVW